MANSVLGDIQNLTGEGPKKPALRVPALSITLEQRPPADIFPHMLFYDSVILLCLRTRERLGLDGTSGDL